MIAFRRYGVSFSGFRAKCLFSLAVITTAAIGCIPVFDGGGGGGGGGTGVPRTLVSRTSSSASGVIFFIATPSEESTVFATVSGNDPGSRPVISIVGANGSGPFRSSSDVANSATVSFTPTEQSYTLSYSEGGTTASTYTIKVTEQ